MQHDTTYKNFLNIYIQKKYYNKFTCNSDKLWSTLKEQKSHTTSLAIHSYLSIPKGKHTKYHKTLYFHTF